ncbi:MAG: hypothetical protein ACLTE2_09570 [Eubacteriales bacterium]
MIRIMPTCIVAGAMGIWQATGTIKEDNVISVCLSCSVSAICLVLIITNVDGVTIFLPLCSRS